MIQEIGMKFTARLIIPDDTGVGSFSKNRTFVLSVALKV